MYQKIAKKGENRTSYRDKQDKLKAVNSCSPYVVCQPAIRSSRSQMFFKLGVLKNFAKFKGKQLCKSQAYNFIKKETLTQRCFPVNFAKFS